MVGARAREIYDREAAERKRAAGGDRKSERAKSVKVPSPEAIAQGQARDLIGKAVGVGGSTIDKATKVLKEGTPEQIAAVESGAASVYTVANGQTVPIVLFEGKILDGRNRYRALVSLGVPPTAFKFDQFRGTAEGAAALAESLNEHRWHLTAEFRDVQIRARRAAGESFRTIKAVMKVSNNTIIKAMATPEVFPTGTPPPAAGVSRNQEGDDARTFRTNFLTRPNGMVCEILFTITEGGKMSGSCQFTLNGSEVWGYVVELDDGFRLRLDLTDRERVG